MYFEVKDTNLRIAGSVHVFPEESPTVPEWLLRALDWCEHLVIESNSNSIIPYRTLENGASLSDLLPQALYDELNSMWPERNMLNRLRPWAVFFSLPTLFMKPLRPGVEDQLISKAQSSPKKVYTLERAEEMVKVFDSLPLDMLTDQLEVTLRNRSNVRKHFLAMHSAWLSRNLDLLQALATEIPMFGIPVLREPLLIKRNHDWMRTLRLALKSKHRILIVVGALHLIGSDNILELLQKEGQVLSALH